jgi:hypothetical protein
VGDEGRRGGETSDSLRVYCNVKALRKNRPMGTLSTSSATAFRLLAPTSIREPRRGLAPAEMTRGLFLRAAFQVTKDERDNAT